MSTPECLIYVGIVDTGEIPQLTLGQQFHWELPVGGTRLFVRVDKGRLEYRVGDSCQWEPLPFGELVPVGNDQIRVVEDEPGGFTRWAEDFRVRYNVMGREPLTVTGDEHREGFKWNLERCLGILYLIHWYLDPDGIHPIAVGVHGGDPVVIIEIEGFTRRFMICEQTRYPVDGGVHTLYASDFNFSIFLDCRPNLTGNLYLLVTSDRDASGR